MRAKSKFPRRSKSIRDERWRRAGTRQVETVQQAERFIEEVGFAACLTDSRRPGPSLYVAVCGRRDAVMPRNVQKDPEASQTWLLKDDIIRRGKVYYAKLARGKAMFIAPRMIPYFNAIWGMKRSEEKSLPEPARAGDPARAPQGMGDEHVGPAHGRRHQEPRGVLEGPRRAAGGDAGGPERSLLSAEIHLHLDARRRPLPRSALEEGEPRNGPPRDRALLPVERGHDHPRRARPRRRRLAPRSRPRQPRARRRRLRDDAGAGLLPAGDAARHDVFF